MGIMVCQDVFEDAQLIIINRKLMNKMFASPLDYSRRNLYGGFRIFFGVGGGWGGNIVCWEGDL